ncbi:MAG TPA: hypothetical protein VHO25_15360 [Polyangiaceae bacterium]|nr:hypothetical protein [Polyangiaceae bacterium]
MLALYPQLSTAHAVTLVRAARLYRDGLWVVESDPQLAWLFFVAAVEAVATPFHVQTVEAVPLFREAHRDLADLLQKTGGDALVEQVATSLLRMMRATGRFIDFTLRYLPPPMDPRPPETLQVKWEPPRMKKALRQIYEYRSRALHDGTPFPPPMSQPESIPTEIPTGLASATMGGVWMSEDTPMLIHVFEHIVRGALLNWWHDASRAG